MRIRHVLAAGVSALVLGIATQTVLPTAGSADHVDAATVIMERQQAMKDMGSAMKAIGGYVQGGVGTTADVEAAAETIGNTAALIPDLFPEHTGMDEVTDPETGAKPIIWEKWDDFVASAESLGQLANAVSLAASAGEDDAIAATFENLGTDGCGGCHKTFRQKLE